MDPVEARAELARRELARRHLSDYVLAAAAAQRADYAAQWFHVEMCDALDGFLRAVEERRSPRLMFFLPPRHGKSHIGSRSFPARGLGLHPDWTFIVASHGIVLAREISRHAQEQVRTRFWRETFGRAMSSRRSSVESWGFDGRGAGGGYIAVGVGGSITGRGGNVLVLDDPFKNYEEAQSLRQRDKVWDWYKTTFATRLAPGAGILVIQTRWHDDDVAGRLLEQEGEDRWDVVEYAAIAERDEPMRRKGEALDPDRYPIEWLLEQKGLLGRQFSPLYQQNPVPDDGGFFKRGDFRWYRRGDVDLEGLRRLSAWDLAVGTKKQNDYSVGINGGLDPSGNLWLLDLRRGRWDSVALAENVWRLEQHSRSFATGIEAGQILTALSPYLRMHAGSEPWWREMKAQNRGDKEARAMTLQWMLRRGKVRLPEHEEWAQQFVGECLRFPSGRHDDQVDAAAWLAILAEEVGPPRASGGARGTRSFVAPRDLYGSVGRPKRDGLGAMAA